MQNKLIRWKNPPANKMLLIKDVRTRARHYIKLREPSFASVAKSVGDVSGHPVPREVLHALSGFGGGIGGSGNVCGALCGGIAVMGLILGEAVSNNDVIKREMPVLVHDKTLDQEEKIKRFNNLVKARTPFLALYKCFVEKWGSINCKDISAPFASRPISVERFRKCHDVIVETAVVVIELLLEIEDSGITLGSSSKTM